MNEIIEKEQILIEDIDIKKDQDLNLSLIH